MKKAEIIICTEEGYLESLSKCLVTSIREFGGKYKDIPIISYQPRKDFKISGVFQDPGAKSSIDFDWVIPVQEYIQRNDW